MTLPTPKPFKIEVEDPLLSFINQRVATGRIPAGEVSFPVGKEWTYGPPSSVMEHLKEYWINKYDWRAIEARINGHLKMFTLPIEQEGETIIMHFVHHRSEREGAVPMLFQHGWPGSFLEVEKVIDSLVSPEDPTQQAYHIIAPSLPGFGFSAASKRPEFQLTDIAAINNKIMLALGYSKYIVQGGDWGSMVSRFSAVGHPENVVACHVNMMVAKPPVWYKKPIAFIRFMIYAIQNAKKETSMLGRMLWWLRDENGYQEIQGTKPQTITYALADSPLGQLAWIRDKIQFLIGENSSWEDEDVITWAMMYIIPGNTGSAAIYTNSKGVKAKTFASVLFDNPIPANIDFGASIFPKELFNVPRFWADACVSKNIVFWKEHSEGGHFAAHEKPVELMEDIREFTKRIEKGRLAALKESGMLKA